MILQFPPATHNIMQSRSLYTYGGAYASVCMDTCMDVWMDAWIDDWEDAWVDKWMDGLGAEMKP